MKHQYFLSDLPDLVTSPNPSIAPIDGICEGGVSSSVTCVVHLAFHAHTFIRLSILIRDFIQFSMHTRMYYLQPPVGS